MDGRNDRIDAEVIDDCPLHVHTTWRLSYDRLNGTAQTLLRLCAHLHRTGITEAMFQDAFNAIDGEYFSSPSLLLSPVF